MFTYQVINSKNKVTFGETPNYTDAMIKCGQLLEKDMPEGALNTSIPKTNQVARIWDGKRLINETRY